MTVVIIKVRPTPQQAGLSRAERLENLKSVFQVRCPERLTGRRVLLLDDVITTAATAEECARVLKAAGVREVWLAAVARATVGRVTA